MRLCLPILVPRDVSQRRLLHVGLGRPLQHTAHTLYKDPMASHLPSGLILKTIHTELPTLLWPVFLSHSWCLCQEPWAPTAGLHVCTKIKCYIPGDISCA